jgi:hypothetical protein
MREPLDSAAFFVIGFAKGKLLVVHKKRRLNQIQPPLDVA